MSRTLKTPVKTLRGGLPSAVALLLGALAVTSGCSDDGVTAKCSEADLYRLRYDDEDEARSREILASDAGAEGLRALVPEADQDRAELQKLADENCVTAPGETSTGN